ncbi:hypothetical protein G6653_08670 [Polynucleobacter paneuropaeus]|jgi:acetyltransferase-like isoleucine patch superfamily enzyme|nr:hypothetical protein [Polynucleobacter paneuropaeus]MBT8612035.1 hypothetical protein [Polynucleobacter paneuropaeus]
MKTVYAILISMLPTSMLRNKLYRLMFGYLIDPSVRIGFLTVIATKSFRADEGVSIKSLNLFRGPIKVSIGAGSRIGKLNRFTCPAHVEDPLLSHMKYTPILEIGKRVLILDENFFDLFGKITIGDDSWIAGHDSQFWTHGVSVMDRDISIGEGNYIGSAVRFAPGSSINNKNVVSIGSVVLSRIDCNHHLISGFPASPYKSIKDRQNAGEFQFNFVGWN